MFSALCRLGVETEPASQVSSKCTHENTSAAHDLCSLVMKGGLSMEALSEFAKAVGLDILEHVIQPLVLGALCRLGFETEPALQVSSKCTPENSSAAHDLGRSVLKGGLSMEALSEFVKAVGLDVF